MCTLDTDTGSYSAFAFNPHVAELDRATQRVRIDRRSRRLGDRAPEQLRAAARGDRARGDARHHARAHVRGRRRARPRRHHRHRVGQQVRARPCCTLLG